MGWCSRRTVPRLANRLRPFFFPLGLVLALLIIAVPAAYGQTPTTEPQGYRGSSQAEAYQGAFADLANGIDEFWEATFVAEQVTYQSPNIVVVERAIQTQCGIVQPVPNAFYCPFDRTIYLVPQFLVDLERRFGDYAPITVLSHEWGHHIQALLGIEGPTRKDFELQADCLMGVFTRHADDEGLLDYGDFMEAMSTSEDGGDPVYLPEDAPGAHGQAEDRIKALTRGYGGGPITGCELPLSGGPVVISTQVVSTGPSPVLLRSLPLAHAGCFHIDGEGQLSFDQLLARFAGIEDAPSRLQDWAWQSSTYRTFGCEGPPEGEAGWIDISIHLFGSPKAAQEAVDYFAAVRAGGTLLVEVAPPSLGDHAAALTGPAVNGKEFTVYASQGPLLIRVTGVSSTGIPFDNVLTVARSVLDAQTGGAPTNSPPAGVSAAAYLPANPAVNYAECFQVVTQGVYAYDDVLTALLPTGMSATQFGSLGWQDGAYIVFSCADPPFGRAAQIDIGIHQFNSEQAARQALSHYAVMYATGEGESRACDVVSALVVCVSGQSDTGSPLSDVHFVLSQVMAGAR